MINFLDELQIIIYNYITMSWKWSIGRIVMNILLLESAISRNSDSRESLAKTLCISRSRLDAKNQRHRRRIPSKWNCVIRNRYHLSLEEIGKIYASWQYVIGSVPLNWWICFPNQYHFTTFLFFILEYFQLII